MLATREPRSRGVARQNVHGGAPARRRTGSSMNVFELVIGLLFVGALLALWANRRGIPYPALLALVGALLALTPWTPTLDLDPELALALFVAPSLLDTAYDASPRDLWRNITPVVSLAFGMVLMTVAAVAVIARLIVPDLTWPVAITLGAIVAPPDASAASAVLRRLQPPHRLLVILEGESLFNDATALLIYRIAVGAAVTGSFSGWMVLPSLVLTCGGAVVVGYVVARAQLWFTSRVEDVPINVLMQFLVTFAVWIIADWIGLSAIITMVTFAMTLARGSGRIRAHHQLASYTVWDVVILVLNVLAFVLIGLQMRGILSRIHPGEGALFAVCASATVLATLVVRIVWVMAHTALDRWRQRHVLDTLESPPTFRSALLSSWCGMRGIVTLAAALALPDGAQPFPRRDLILACAFAVVLTTLVLQGLTLAPLLRWLGLRDEGTVDHEVRLAREETARAALRFLEDQPEDLPVAILAAEYRTRLESAEVEDEHGEAEHVDTSNQDAELTDLQLRAVALQRQALTKLRADHRIGDDAYHVVEHELALLEITADTRVHPTPPKRT